MKYALIMIILFITGCVDSFWEHPEKVVNVTIDGRVIMVIDNGATVEMRRKGAIHSHSVIINWQDFIKAGQIVTGCAMVNLIPSPRGGTHNLYYWVEAQKGKALSSSSKGCV